MIEIIWMFQSRSECLEDFIRIYGPEGDWARLFRRSPGYVETVLSRDLVTAMRFVVIDRWHDLASFEAFKAAHLSDYEALDRKCESLTTLEEKVGVFTTISGATNAAVR